jgi:hypothetical protein
MGTFGKDFNGNWLPFDSSLGEQTASYDIQRINRVAAMGGKIDYINLDGPFRDMLHPNFPASLGGGLSITTACEELIDYMQTINTAYPNVQFFILWNTPLWGWKDGVAYTGINQFMGDWYDIMETFLPMVQAAGVPVRGVTTDNSYDYATKQWPPPWVHTDDPAWQATDFLARQIDAENYIKSKGLEFNVIFNSQHGGQLSAEDFYNETLAYVKLYRERGGSPDRVIVQSWDTYPTVDQIVPETTTYTNTNLAKEVIRYLHCVNPSSADIDQDCHVEMNDVAIMVSQWLKCQPNLSADIAPSIHDGKVNLSDCSVLVQDWMACGFDVVDMCFQ